MLQQGKNISNIQSAYFIGIGGIGMSALARYFLSLGKKVSGYDKTETPLTRQLTAEGANVHYDDDINQADIKADIVVYTPAIPQANTILAFFKDNNYPLLKRSDVLGMISASSFNICVAGTHGKTTTSTMVAHLLTHSGYGCSAFLGGISANYNTNFLSSKNNVCVIEADEYDRSFLKLSPDVAIITAADADHLDIYENEEAVTQAYVDFAGKIKPDGHLIKKLGILPMVHTPGMATYSATNNTADVHAANVQLHHGGYLFNVVFADKIIYGIQLNMGGMHNIENMVAAIAVADKLGIDAEKIKTAVAAFKGVKRRFEYILPPQTGALQHCPVYIDDYAHHPEELSALLKSVKALFPQKKCTVVFQPHLYSRTKDFASEFATALSIADEVVLLPVYAAREAAVPGVSSQIIADGIEKPCTVLNNAGLATWMKDVYIKKYDKEFGQVLVTAGAGDIDQFINPIKQILQSAC